MDLIIHTTITDASPFKNEIEVLFYTNVLTDFDFYYKIGWRLED